MVKKCKNKYLCALKKWLCQRRLWAAALSGVAVFGLQAGYAWVPELTTALAGILALHSYAKPKK